MRKVWYNEANGSELLQVSKGKAVIVLIVRSIFVGQSHSPRIAMLSYEYIFQTMRYIDEFNEFKLMS